LGNGIESKKEGNDTRIGEKKRRQGKGTKKGGMGKDVNR